MNTLPRESTMDIMTLTTVLIGLVIVLGGIHWYRVSSKSRRLRNKALELATKRKRNAMNRAPTMPPTNGRRR